MAHDGAANDQFGLSVAMDGDYAIVGAWKDDGKGSAYIYNIHTGAEIHKLIASDGASGDEFGDGVAISGNYAVVGAPRDNIGGDNVGIAYVFNVKSGEFIHKLDHGETYDGDTMFGHSVDIDGIYAIVGGYYDDTNHYDSGAAWIFNVQTGAKLWKLKASNPEASAKFGDSVAISGNYAIVGANGYDSLKGSAYIFNVQTGAELHKLVASDGVGGDTFGDSVAISGNYAIVGAQRDHTSDGSDAGSAYIFNIQTGEQLHKLYAINGNAWDTFGSSVAIDGNYAVVGSDYYNSSDGSDAGTAFIFDAMTGLLVKQLFASDAAGADRFGKGVAISNNYVIIGARDDNSSTGSAYIYRPNDPLPPLLSIDNDSGNVGIGTTEPKSLLDVNGTLQATTLTSTNLKVGRDFSFSLEKKIVAHDGAASDYFGYSVAISDNYAIVGAYGDDSNIGSAYIYNVHTGAEIHKLTAGDGESPDFFGYSVAISDNYAIVGSKLDDTNNNTNTGSAYIFNVQTGTQLHKLTAIDREAWDEFGKSVAISGNYVIVGAWYSDDAGEKSGSAYIFNVQTGTQLHKLVASDDAVDDRFGMSVAISGNYVIVGAPWNDDGGSNSGSAYIFNVQTGAQLHKLTANDAAAGDEFGASASISGNYAIVGARYDDDAGEKKW